ncbi:GPI inositol deacylase [Entomortierella beljakovae]|nr:GPI inositol deacylase [Entomortierella beljakovae]
MSEKHILDPRETETKETSCSTEAVSSHSRKDRVPHNFYHQVDPKGCLMTYMQPTYYKILGFDEKYTPLAGKYGLLLYRDEGDEHPRLYANQLKQLDSSDWAIAKSAKIHPRVDLNEEFSAFHGQLLLDQSRYVNEVIAYILSLYDGSTSDNPRPESVLIVGHSMGGIVARTLFTMDNFVHGSVNTILTIATPHMIPPLALDNTITNIYSTIERYWTEGYIGPDAILSNVSLVSIMGGTQDITVNSDSGNIHYFVPQSHGFSVFTTSIPHAWVGSDHLSILWCNQVVKQIGAALVEAVDARSPTQVKPLYERIKAFRNHLLSEKSYSNSQGVEENKPLVLSKDYYSIETGDTWGSSTSQEQKIYHHILPIPKQTNLDTFVLLTNLNFNTQSNFNIILCNDGPQSGSEDKILICGNDSLPAITIPGSMRESTMPLFTGEYFTGQEFFSISVPLRNLENFQYVVLVNSRGFFTGSDFIISQFKNDKSTIDEISTSVFGLLWDGIIREKVSVNPSLSSALRLPNIDNSLFAYKLKVTGGSCPRARFAPLMKQSNWATNEDRFSVNIANKDSIDINFHGDLPYYDKVLLNGNNGIELRFWSDPTCEEPLSIHLVVDKYGSLGRIIIRYRTTILVFTFMVVILVLRAQLVDWGKSGSFKPFGVILSSLIKSTTWKFSLLLVAIAFLQSLSGKSAILLATESAVSGIQSTELSWRARRWVEVVLLGRNETFFWVLLPLFLHIGVGIVAFVWFILSTLISLLSIPIRTTIGSGSVQNSGSGGASAAIGWIFALLSVAVPYQFAFAATVIVLLMSCSRKLAIARSVTDVTYSQMAWDRFHFSTSMFVLYFFLLPFAVPSLMVWIRNIAGGWFRSFPSDHRLDYVAPFIIFVEGISNGTAVTETSWKRYLTVTIKLLDGIMFNLILSGTRYSWQIYTTTGLWVAWLLLLRAIETNIGRKVESQIRYMVVPKGKQE